MYLLQEHVQKCGDVILKTFDELTVRLSLDSTNLQHRKLAFQLITPHVPGFSYVSEDQAMKVDQETDINIGATKRKEAVEPTRKGSKKKNKKK